ARGGFALPWVDGVAFARRAMGIALADRAAAGSLDGWVFFDRGLIDAAAALTGQYTSSQLSARDLASLGNIVGALIERVRFAADSPVEGSGFEPSVPRGKGPTLRVSVLSDGRRCW